jgi:hypothetical protein
MHRVTAFASRFRHTRNEKVIGSIPISGSGNPRFVFRIGHLSASVWSMAGQEKATSRIAWIGLAAQVLFALNVLVSGLVAPGYSFLNNDTSDLGAKTSPNALPYNIALSVSGLLSFCVAVALSRTLEKSRLQAAGIALIGVFSAGQFIDGIAREDCPVSVDAGCRAAEKAGELSLMHLTHNVESLFTFSALMLAPLVLAFAFRRVANYKSLFLPSVVSGVIQLVCLPIFLAMYDAGAGGQGAVEIFEFFAGVAWLAAVSRRAALISSG